MALSNAEKVRRYRERQKEQEKIASLTLDNVFALPFFEFWQDGSYQSDLENALGLAGLVAPVIEDDQPPEAFVLPHIIEGLGRWVEDDPFGRLEHATSQQGSLPRAEVMLDQYLDAARVLADALNAYKRQEIKARLAEIEASDLSEPDAKKAALQQAARLQKMLDQLDKQVRHTFPQWKVTG